MSHPQRLSPDLDSDDSYDGQDMLEASDVLEEYEPAVDAEGDDEGEEPMIIDATGDDEYEAAERPYMAELDLHEGEPSYAIAASPTDGCLMASAGGNDRVVIFRLAKAADLQMEIITELLGHTDTVEHVQFSVDGELVATGSLDGQVRIWKVHDWSLAHVLEGSSEVTWLEWHPKGAILAAGGSDGTVWLWNAASGRCMQVFSGNATTSTCGSFTADGKTLVSACDGVLFVWNPREATAAITYGGHAGANFPLENVISLACHPVLPVATAGFADGTVATVHLQRHQILHMQSTGEQPIEYVGYKAGQSVLVTAGLQGALYVWDANNYKSRAVLEAPEIDGITACQWLSQRGHVAVGCLNGTVAVWDIHSNAKVAAYSIGLEEDAVFALCEVPDRHLLLASFDDGKIRIYPLL